ncbi:hypothetical protein IQ07DRAFT_666090 [Pyrenochaeta sp. DS3sAY3a]|nr:hypothetical protein IQ07DRAFT_666090 [Pyrenochaeta sp. DS3sAY3a]
MRFQATLAAFAASLAFVNAQDLSGVPTCAIPCFVAALPGSGCGITDTVCQCTTGRESIQNSILSCAPQRCSESDVATIASAVQTLCANAGVTISNVPTAAPTSGTTLPSGSSAASAATTVLSGTRTMSMTASRSATGSAPASQSTGAAVGGRDVSGWGGVVGLLVGGVFAL